MAIMSTARHQNLKGCHRIGYWSNYCKSCWPM